MILINTHPGQFMYMLSKCRNGESFGNGIIPTEIRYPKRDVFRLHHKQKAAIFSEKDSLRKSRSGVTNAQNNIWVKRLHLIIITEQHSVKLSLLPVLL